MIGQILSEILTGLKTGELLTSLRYNRRIAYHRKDKNIFGPSSALFILENISHFLNTENKLLFEQIKDSIIAEYKDYQNKDGRITYNFYPTRPSQHFPNGFIMQHFDHFRLPDDIDDTAIITYTLNKNKAEVAALQKLTVQFAEHFPDGKDIYNTWYGKNMPKEQDVCAILNLLYLFFYYQLDLSKVDKGSLEYLQKMIPHIESQPFKIARHYATPSLILYHYARFMSVFNTGLDTEKDQIINMIKNQLNEESNPLHRMMMATSFMKMTDKRHEIELSNTEFKNGYTFIGAPFAPFSNILAKTLSKNQLTHIFWRSEIHIKALFLEYLCYLDLTR